MASLELTAFIIRAMDSWERLQDAVWGPRWDGTRASLDFTRESFFTLSGWLELAAREQSAEALEQILCDAGQYFGEVVQVQFMASWEQVSGAFIGLRIHLTDGQYRELDIGSLASMWRAHVQPHDGCYRDSLFVRHYDEIVESARPTDV